MIPLSKQPRIVEQKGSQATFEIEALYPGYGVTMGNSLRRVLLSSLEGAAVTHVKLKGVPHEFSPIDGVLQDLTSILLNIKQMRFRSFAQEPQKAILKAKGEKKIEGSAFELPSQLELINKDIHIATLTSKKSELEMELQVEKGIGYVPVEARKQDKQEIGSIALDAIFTPVKRVSFKVDHMRVGERTDFDRLLLTLETDGTISPEEAMFQATDILVKQLEVVRQGAQEIVAQHALKEEKTASTAVRRRGGKAKAKPKKASKDKSKKK